MPRCPTNGTWEQVLRKCRLLIPHLVAEDGNNRGPNNSMEGVMELTKEYGDKAWEALEKYAGVLS